MTNPLSMFCEKDLSGQRNCWSMTRVTTFAFMLTVCYSMILYARGGHEVGWPFCILGVTTLMAVPVQALFKLLHQWAATRDGSALLKKVGAAAAEKLIPGASTVVKTVGGETTVKTNAVAIETDPLPEGTEGT